MLEFLHELFDMLKNEGYIMTEAEAAIFLPCLIEKVLPHDLLCLNYYVCLSCGGANMLFCLSNGKKIYIYVFLKRGY